MGALPKRKLSGRRRGNRRSHTHIAVSSLARCPRCRNYYQTHHACPNCGFYKDRIAVEIPVRGEPGSQF